MATPAALIKAARLARGWTQQELADRLHRSRSVVSRVESGVQPLRDLELLHALAHALDLPIGGAELGLLAVDRARTLAPASGDPVLIAEAARQTAVLVRRTGWQGQAQQIALDAAEDLAGLPGPYAAAQRGLLLQSAAYSAAKAQDAAGMRELTDEAERVAAAAGGAVLLRHHGGGFSRLGVELHRISGSAAAGDIGQALKAAQAINPAALPTVERRARYWGDVAGVALQAGRPSLCLDALLAAERLAPQEVRARPAVVECARDLLATGRTSPRLRDLADRLGIT